MSPTRLSDEVIATMTDIARLESEVVTANAEAVRWEEYSHRCRRRLVELRGYA